MKSTIIFFILFASFDLYGGRGLPEVDSLPRNIYILSIGINTSFEFLSCEYCHDDAVMMANYFQGKKQADSVIKFVLTGKLATKDSITKAIRKIAFDISPNDIFIFFFAGISFEGNLENNIFKEKTIFFVPYKPSSAGKFNWDVASKEAISLNQLKNLIDLIQAKRQLILTEAGTGQNFSEYLTNTFIDKDIYNAQSNERNRVFLTTYGFGTETQGSFVYAKKDNCGYTSRYDEIRGGPMVFFLTHLDSIQANIFDLFNSDKTFERKLHYAEELNSCSPALRKAYTNIIYERDILKIVKSVANNLEKGASRGSQLLEDENKPGTANPPAPKLKNYALLIGTDLYKSAYWHTLRNPVFDVKKIDALLKENYGFETELLLDTSRKAILAALKRYSKMSFDSSSQLLIFIAGHGMYDENNFGLIACSDSEDPKDDADFDTYISHSRLRDNLNAIKCQHLMVVLDVCFGGTFNQSFSSMQMLNTTDVSLLDTYKKNQVNDADFARRLMGIKTRLYITSGGKEYVPDGLPGHHSPFASGFIAALESKGGNDKILNCGEIRSKVIRLVPEPRGGSFDSGSDGDFVFIAK